MSTIFTLSIECVGGMYLKKPYQFVLALSVETTLNELAAQILDIVKFEDDHLDEFYIANTPHSKKTWLTPDGEWDEDDESVMDLQLSAIFPLPKNKKLYYLFDYGASWCFQIGKRGKETQPEANVSYPCIMSKTGVKPKQYG